MPPVGGAAGKWAAATPCAARAFRFADTFLPWGRALEVGELFHFPAAARSQIAAANGVTCDVRRRDCREALAAFAKEGRCPEKTGRLPARVVTPISRDYRGYTLHEIPPNGRGIAALIALGVPGKVRSGPTCRWIPRRRNICRSKR